MFLCVCVCVCVGASQVVLVVKNLSANAGDIRDAGSIPVSKIPWRRAWQPTPVFLPGKSHGQRSLVGYNPRSCKESTWLKWLSIYCTLWTVACQAPLSMGFSRQEYWSGLPCISPGDLPNPETEPISLYLLHWQVDSLSLCHLGSQGSVVNPTMEARRECWEDRGRNSKFFPGESGKALIWHRSQYSS